MRKRVALLSVSIFLGVTSVISQTPIIPKKADIKGDYVHAGTGAIFPESIDDFSRRDIWYFDDEKTNAGVNYIRVMPGEKATLSLYVYPAGDADEDRLRNEYLLSLYALTSIIKNGYSLEQGPVFFSDSGYKIYGFRGNIKNFKEKTVLSIYECGKWFFKIRISSSDLNANQLQDLDTRVLNLFVPTRFVKNAPLNPKTNIYFSKAAFADSLMLGCNMGSAFAKIEWAYANVDSLQRISGFPGLYLDMYIAGFDEFLKFASEHSEMNRSYNTNTYLSQIKLLKNSGYLDEFIMEQFSMVMIPPEKSNFDFDGYHRWKKIHPINLNLHEKYYVLKLSE